MKRFLLLSTWTLFIAIVYGQSPVLDCQSDTIVNNDPGMCGAVVTYDIPICTSNCSGVNISQTDATGYTSGDFFPTGVYVMEYTATNANGSSTCSFIITVEDKEAPSILCQNTDIYLDVNCSYAVEDYYNENMVNANDNCAITSHAQNVPVGTMLTGVGTTQSINVTVFDNAGYSTSCSFDIILVDTIAPSFTCPGTIIEPTTSGCDAVLQDYTALISPVDGCDANPSISQFPASGTAFTTSQSVTLYAEDASGNIDSCSFNVVSNDISAPSITCPNNFDVYADISCEYVIDDYSILATVTDNCSSSFTFTQTPSIGTKISGNNTNQLVSLQVSDAAGLSSSCSFQITLLDTLSPTFNLCEDTLIPLNHNCEYELEDFTAIVGINENCGAFSAFQVPGPGTMISGETITQIVISASDLNSNTSTCVMNIITADTTSPNIVSCPSSGTESTGANDCTYTVPDYASQVFATDNCSSSLNISQSIAPGMTLTAGTTSTIDILVSDDAGNSNTCSFDVTVVDLVAPNVICLSNPDVPVNSFCSYEVPSFDSILTITDNCGTVSNYSQIPVAGTILNGIGTQQSVSVFIEDDNGNTNSCSFTVTLADTTAPSVTCPNTQSLTIDGNCEYEIIDFESLVTFSDFCDAAPTYSQSPVAGTTTGGINDVTITITDVSGNSSTCIFEVQPDDQIVPIINCPNSMASCDPIFTFNDATGSDNCGLPTITRTDLTGLNSGDTFPVGTTTIEFTATDEVGNDSVCSFDLTVYPTPVITMENNHFIEEGDSVNLNALVDVYDTFTWTPSYNLSNDTILNPWASPNASVTYTLSVSTNFGCSSSDTVLVDVDQDFNLIINNYLSPNGDGKNDFWTMSKPSLINGCVVTIYDRWGKDVWETTSYNNQWDGKNSSGTELPDGTYFYVIRCSGEDDLKGSILLMR